MPFDHDTVLNWPIPERVETVRDHDTMLYALGVGVGARPTAASDLAFVLEKNLHMLPSMVSLLAHPGLWMADPGTGVAWQSLLHGEEGFRILRPLPATGTFRSRTRVVDIIDRGPARGALVYLRREIFDEADGAKLAEVSTTTFCRGDGGCGGPSRPTPAPHAVPDRAPDAVLEVPTLPQQALIYRLCGDRHPIHADPDFAAAQGFDRPILQGLCTFGIVCHALLRLVCDDDPARLIAMQARFTAPVYPGETLRTEVWRAGRTVAFRAGVVGRGVVVLGNGHAEITDANRERR